jgi:TetR/AcrR family transcriptional regulator
MSGTAAVPAWAAARVIRADKGHETRTLLLDSAARVFARLGYARTTIADIAAEANVSRPAFYAYFASKPAVFTEVAARVREEFLAAHEIPGVDESDPYVLGHASSAAFLAAYAANSDLLTVIEHQAIADPAIAEIWAEIQHRPTRRVARYVRRLAADGIAHPAAAPDLVAEAVVGIFARFARFAPADEAAFDDLVEALTAMYLRLIGIAAADPQGAGR